MILESIIHFNIASLFIFAIIIFYIVYRRMYKAYSSFVFLTINALYFIVCLLDILVSAGILNLTMNKILMFLYYALKYMTSIVYLLYIVLVTKSEDIIRKKRNAILFSIPFVITFGFLISNFFNGYIYYFDENGIYNRGDLIFVFYGLSFVYVIIGFIWLILNRKMFKFADIFSLFSVYVFSIIALLVQYFNGDILIEMLASSMGFLLLSVTIERSQMVVEPKTGLKNRSLFDKAIYASFKRDRKIGIVLLYIRNYAVIYERFKYSDVIKKLRFFSDMLDKSFMDVVTYKTYFLNEGKFVFTTYDSDDASVLANLLNEWLIKSMGTRMVFNIDYVICYAKTPDDFNSLNEFQQFLFNFSDSIEFERLVSVSDVKKDKKHNILMKLDDIIPGIIKNKDIMVEFQPLLELAKNKYTIVEAFARIYDSELGFINAENFIPYAEKMDLIYEIDMLVMEKVFGLYDKIIHNKYGIDYIAINISIQTICNPEFLKELKALETKYKINKKTIYFEINERENMSFNKNVIDNIKSLVNKGYLFALDNYGIGSMAVDNLAKVPFVNVKFDNLFARSCDNKNVVVVVDNTIKLFKNLSKMSICTGIEDENSAKVLESLNPDYVQGVYYSRPLDVEELLEFLRLHNTKLTT